MYDEIDFTRWTDAQLDVGARYAATPAEAEAIAAEQAARAGTDDGSRERVAALAAASAKARRPRRNRRA